VKKIILIGKSGSGKTTAIQKIEGLMPEYSKTQVVTNYRDCVDTPGEYLEKKFFYNALIVTAADANIIGLVEDASCPDAYFPPMISMSYAREVIGIVTKIDIATEREIANAADRLLIAGAEKIFKISNVTGEGISDLCEYLY
jgi:ethanolamine utilization protein EutP